MWSLAAWSPVAWPDPAAPRPHCGHVGQLQRPLSIPSVAWGPHGCGGDVSRNAWLSENLSCLGLLSCSVMDPRLPCRWSAVPCGTSVKWPGVCSASPPCPGGSREEGPLGGACKEAPFKIIRIPRFCLEIGQCFSHRKARMSDSCHCNYHCGQP